jgi:hypothetical protein
MHDPPVIWWYITCALLNKQWNKEWHVLFGHLSWNPNLYNGMPVVSFFQYSQQSLVYILSKCCGGPVWSRLYQWRPCMCLQPYTLWYWSVHQDGFGMECANPVFRRRYSSLTVGPWNMSLVCSLKVQWIWSNSLMLCNDNLFEWNLSSHKKLTRRVSNISQSSYLINVESKFILYLVYQKSNSIQ